MMEEKDLISRAARDDADAFRQLVETYQTPAYRLAARMCGPDGAEDVTQEAFLAAWRGLPQFRGDCRFSTWLYRLVNNAAIDYLRREKRHRDTGDVTTWSCWTVTRRPRSWRSRAIPARRCAAGWTGCRRSIVRCCCCAICRSWTTARSPRCWTSARAR